ncbi:hypothetical protein THUN1379_24470 [Paludibacterium sp. THUN1379]|nr:hypothetical protein THUN1379_24470 [Paludibacterium sp. THUN1379]
MPAAKINIDAITKGKGVVVFSTESQKTSAAMCTSLSLVNGSNRKKYDGVTIVIDSPFDKSDFSGFHGNVRALTLPAGEYYLLPNILNPYFITTKAPVYKFYVHEGVIEYIGNFKLSNRNLNWSGAEYNRDYGVIRQNNPGLSGVQVRQSMAYYAGDLSKFELRGIIWGAP